jgi:DNA-binding beta-propeller fold protein YncE
LNTVLASGGAASGQAVEALDGATFQTLAVVNGSCPSVDSVTSRFWAAGVFSDSVLVYNGNSYALVATIGGGTGCPIGTAADPGRRRIWVAAQCGGGNDPVWAVNADAFALTSIMGSGGVMGSLVVNTATGRAYLGSSGVSKRIDPSSGFALTPNGFGVVGAVNPVTNRLYAPGGGGNGIQVIDGAANPEVVLTTVQLPFTPGAIGINSATNQVYVVNSAGSSLAVLDGATNALTGTILLGSGFNPSAIAVDPTRKRIYVIGAPASGPALSIIAGS